MTYTSKQVDLAMSQFQSLTVLKSFAYLFYLFTNISTLTTNFPIIGSALYPLYIAGSSGLVTYADLTTLLLFKFVGTTYDPTNPFCYWMFFLVPAYRVADNYLAFIATNWATFHTQITTSATPGGLVYSLYYVIAAAYLGLRFNMGQLLIGARVYHSDFF